ncbi:hypothetical protein JYU34_004875 [Plutella xylostella]|uniref:Uncharacterized protein n=1 Tax=Plutella xylostella TaxID=51655 RepID=A0ABQ7QVD9_PLUXY|nr:hypothetical protein JYU34_004875 [Plutella xylostella]
MHSECVRRLAADCSAKKGHLPRARLLPAGAQRGDPQLPGRGDGGRRLRALHGREGTRQETHS